MLPKLQRIFCRFIRREIALALIAIIWIYLEKNICAHRGAHRYPELIYSIYIFTVSKEKKEWSELMNYTYWKHTCTHAQMSSDILQ